MSFRKHVGSERPISRSPRSTDERGQLRKGKVEKTSEPQSDSTVNMITAAGTVLPLKITSNTITWF